MSSFNNNFTGINFGYPYLEDESLINSDAPIAGPSRSQDWYLNPAPEGYGEQFGYEGSTLLDASEDQLVDPRATHPDAFGSSEAEEDVYGFNTHERTFAKLMCPPVGDNSTTHPTYPLPPTPPYTTGNLPHGAYDQPLAGPSSTSQWPVSHTTPSVDKGKARATDHQLPPHPASVGNDMWLYERPPVTESYGIPLPHTVYGVPLNTDPPVAIAPSYGPQRSGADVKGKGKAAPVRKGRRKREPSDPLPGGANSSWEQTKDRFVWKLLKKYYFRRAGASIDPEKAFAKVKKFIKEDLRRSPLAAQAAEAKEDGRESRVYERYLINVLKELRRSEYGEIDSELDMYTRVLQELEGELAPINGRRVLRGGRSSAKKDPNELSNSKAKVNHREAEKKRRETTRDLLDQMSVFFLVKGQKKVSVGELLLFVVIYLRIGEIAFPGLINPRFPSRRQ